MPQFLPPPRRVCPPLMLSAGTRARASSTHRRRAGGRPHTCTLLAVRMRCPTSDTSGTSGGLPIGLQWYRLRRGSSPRESTFGRDLPGDVIGAAHGGGCG